MQALLAPEQNPGDGAWLVDWLFEK